MHDGRRVRGLLGDACSPHLPWPMGASDVPGPHADVGGGVRPRFPWASRSRVLKPSLVSVTLFAPSPPYLPLVMSRKTVLGLTCRNGSCRHSK